MPHQTPYCKAIAKSTRRAFVAGQTLHACHDRPLIPAPSSSAHPLFRSTVLVKGTSMQQSMENSLPRSSAPVAAQVVELCIRGRWWVVALAIVLLVLSSAYAATHLVINTDTAGL